LQNEILTQNFGKKIKKIKTEDDVPDVSDVPAGKLYCKKKI
jgi:hypothetical protein